MTDPASSSVHGLYIGLGLASLLPLIDVDALFGAVLGGWVLTSARRHFKAWQHLGSFLLSTGVGYLFMPVVLPLAPMLSHGVAAFICALMIVPLSIKVMIWVDGADLLDILQRFRGG